MTRTAEPEVPAVHSESDLDVEARRWAIGYSGVSQVPTGAGTLARAGDRRALLDQPDARHRHRGRSRLARADRRSVGQSMDKDSVFGFVLQGGLPLALATHRHVSFQVIPFVTFAHGQTSTGATGATTDFSGMRLEVGARTGFELFFGFIGIPELALSATVGLQFETSGTADQRRPDPERHHAPLHDDGPEQSLGYLRRQRRRPVLFLACHDVASIACVSLACALPSWRCAAGPAGPPTPPSDPDA